MSVGAAVVQGAAGTFCSGADRRRWQPRSDQAEDKTYKEAGAVYRAFTRVGELTVPTIAAVRGAAGGAGMNLDLATDMRIVAKNASDFGVLEDWSASGWRLLHHLGSYGRS